MSIFIILLLICTAILIFFFTEYGGNNENDIPTIYTLFLVFVILFIVLITINTTTTTNQNITIYKDMDKKVSIYCGYYPNTEICIELNKISFKNLDNILTQEQKEKISNSVKDIENKIQNIKID